VGYNESSKAYRIYIPSQRQIEVSRDVIFEEEITFRRSRESQMEIDNEIVPSPPSTVQRETVIDPVDLVDPVAPVDVPRNIAVGHKRPTWARQTAGCRGTCNSLRHIPREQETTKIFELCFIHESHH
jgi:hypothetical protein